MRIFRALPTTGLVVLFSSCVPRVDGVVATDGRDFGQHRWEDGLFARCEADGDFWLTAVVFRHKGGAQQAQLKVSKEHVDVQFPWTHVVLHRSDCTELTSTMERRPEDNAPTRGAVKINCAQGDDTLSVDAVIDCNPPWVYSPSAETASASETRVPPG